MTAIDLLSMAGEQVRIAELELARAVRERDALIVEAKRDGVRGRVIADLTGMSEQRVSNILHSK